MTRHNSSIKLRRIGVSTWGSSLRQINGVKHEYLDLTRLILTILNHYLSVSKVLDLEASTYHWFEMGSYMSYCQVGEFLTNSNYRSNYKPELGPIKIIFDFDLFFTKIRSISLPSGKPIICKWALKKGALLLVAMHLFCHTPCEQFTQNWSFFS